MNSGNCSKSKMEHFSAHHPKQIILLASWSPPPMGWFKLNTDVVRRAGMILRDHAEKIISSSCHPLFSCSDALKVKLCACMEDITLTLQWCTTLMLVEGIGHL